MASNNKHERPRSTSRSAVFSVLLLLVLSGCDFQDGSDEPFEVQWRFAHEPAGTAPAAAPLLLGDTLTVAATGLDLVALRLQEGGEIKWRTRATEEFTLQGRSLTTDGEKIYAMHLRDFRAYDLSNGQEQWRREFDHLFYDVNYDAVKLIAVEGTLFGGSRRGDIYAFDAATGQLRYSIDPPEAGSPFSFVEKDGIVYVGTGWNSAYEPGREPNSADGVILAMEPATGDTLWSFHTTGGAFWYAPIHVNDGIIYGATDGLQSAVYALEAETGTVLWERREWNTYDLILEGDHLYGNAGYHLYSRDRRDGRLLWRHEFDGLGQSNVVHLDGYLYHGHGSILYIIDAATGEEVHRTEALDGTYFWHLSATEGYVVAQTTTEVVAYTPYRP